MNKKKQPMTEKQLLSDYHAWVLDGVDASYSPSIRTENETPFGDWVVIQFFNGNDYTPQELINHTIPTLEALFQKYFDDVFFSPLWNRVDYGSLRFNRLHVSAEENEIIGKLLSGLSSKNNELVILNFIAEAFDFYHSFLKELLTKDGVIHLQELAKESQKYNMMLKKAAEGRFTKIENIVFNFRDETFLFANPAIIRFIKDKIISGKSANLYSFNFPRLKDYEVYYKRQMILSLHQFLINEEKGMITNGEKTNTTITSFITNLLLICGIHFVDTYGNSTTDLKLIQNQIKTTINRYSV